MEKAAWKGQPGFHSGMELLVACAMEDRKVVHRVRPPQMGGSFVVDFAALFLLRGVMAVGTNCPLFSPQASLLGVRQVASLVHSSLLEVLFPLRVVGVCPCSDFDMTADVCLSQSWQENIVLPPPFSLTLTSKDPVSAADAEKELTVPDQKKKPTQRPTMRWVFAVVRGDSYVGGSRGPQAGVGCQGASLGGGAGAGAAVRGDVCVEA
ncbi:MAG: hypothetical protein AAF471_05575, partial [Myxococcota bacterium]